MLCWWITNNDTSDVGNRQQIGCKGITQVLTLEFQEYNVKMKEV